MKTQEKPAYPEWERVSAGRAFPGMDYMRHRPCGTRSLTPFELLREAVKVKEFMDSHTCPGPGGERDYLD